MSDQLFEIAFSGQIADGADLATVKKYIAAMFKADEGRLAQLFSGKRMIIKRSVDAATAAKYRGAFEKAGAVCEVSEIGRAEVQAVTQPQPSVQQSAVAAPPAESSPAPKIETAEDYVSRYPESEQIPQALLTEPLEVRGEDIPDLAADIAPVGSMMQHQIKEDPEPHIDTSGFDVAPVGSVLTTGDKSEPPPPPDTTGITLAD
jgi:hypothetical protein